MNNSELTLKARGIARCMTYNDDDIQAEAKHMLHELSHRLDTLDVRVNKEKDGFILIDGLGKSRFLNIKERIIYHIFGYLPKNV